MTSRPWRIIYILGTGHNGSTLLSMLLDDLRDVTSYSEIQRLPEVFHKLTGPDRTDAGEWRKIEDAWKARTGKTFAGSADEIVVPNHPFRFLGWLTKLSRFRKGSDAMFDVLAGHAGTEIICDASKMPTRALALKLLYGDRVRIVCLDRDVRSVLKSYIKLGAAPRDMAFRIFGCFVGGRLLKLIYPDTVMMKYEQLARSPDAEVARVVQGWLPEIVRKTAPPLRLFAGGNPMKKTYVGVDPKLAQVNDPWPAATPGILRTVNRWSGYGDAAEPAAG